MTTTASGRNVDTSSAHCSCQNPAPPHLLSTWLPSNTKTGKLTIGQARIARFQTEMPGWAERPKRPGSARMPCARVAACESPTTSTFSTSGVRVGRGRARSATCPTCPLSARLRADRRREHPDAEDDDGGADHHPREAWRTQAHAAADRVVDQSRGGPRERDHDGETNREQREPVETGAVRRDHEVRGPVPEVHLVRDPADPADGFPRQRGAERAGTRLGEAPEHDGGGDAVDEQAVPAVEEVVHRGGVRREPRRDDDEQAQRRRDGRGPRDRHASGAVRAAC